MASHPPSSALSPFSCVQNDRFSASFSYALAPIDALGDGRGGASGGGGGGGSPAATSSAGAAPPAHTARGAAPDDPLELLSSWGGRVASLSRLRPRYHIEWPIGIAISGRSVALLARVHRFLLCHRDAESVLAASWLATRRRGRAGVGDAGERARLRWQHVFRAELQHFVGTVDAYLHSQVVDGCWKWFEPQIGGARDLRSLRALHDRYTERCADLCFLRASEGGLGGGGGGVAARSAQLQHQVLSCILTCYRCVFRFSTALATNRAAAEACAGALPEAAFAQLTGQREYFRGQLRFLYTALRMASRSGGGMEHMQDLLMRLNFNGFYTASSRAPPQRSA